METPGSPDSLPGAEQDDRSLVDRARRGDQQNLSRSSRHTVWTTSYPTSVRAIRCESEDPLFPAAWLHVGDRRGARCVSWRSRPAISLRDDPGSRGPTGLRAPHGADHRPPRRTTAPSDPSDPRGDRRAQPRHRPRISPAAARRALRDDCLAQRALGRRPAPATGRLRPATTAPRAARRAATTTALIEARGGPLPHELPQRRQLGPEASLNLLDPTLDIERLDGDDA